MRAHKFNVGLEYSGESDRDHSLFITGVAQPYIPAVTSGPADNWSPAEGGELEDLEIFMVYKGKQRRLPRKIEDRLADDERFLERIYEALSGEK